MHQTATVLYFACVAGGTVAWVLAVVEMIGAWCFWPWSFRVGPRWVHRTIDGWQHPRSFAVLELGTQPPILRVRMLDTGEILFRDHIPLASAFTGPRHTVSPFKGRVAWLDGTAHLEIRSPLGPLAFMCFWLVGWSTGALAIAHDHFAQATAIWSVGASFVTGMLWWSFVTERRRLQVALDRLTGELGWTPISVAAKQST